MRSRLIAYFYLTLVAAIWGVATPVIKFTLQGIGPLPFLAYRFAISAIFAILFILVTRPYLGKIKKNFPEVFVYSFITTTFALGILFLGLEKTTVVDTALITAVGPLVTAIAGLIFLKEHITSQEKLGISIAFVGTLLTVFEPVLRGQVNLSQLTGNFLVVGYILVMGLSAVLSKRLVRKDVEPLLLTNISFIIGFLTLAPLAVLQSGTSQLVGNVATLAPQYHLGVWYMALLSGTLAYALWVRGQRTIEISEAGVFAYLIPVFAIPLGIVWLGEQLTLPVIIGATLIVIGVSLAEYKKSFASSS